MKCSKLLFLMLPVLTLTGAVREVRNRQPLQWEHKGATRLLLSRDGSTLVSEGDSGEQPVRVWSVRNRQLLDAPKFAPDQSASVLAVSDDGRRVLVSRKRSENEKLNAQNVCAEMWDSEHLRRVWTIADKRLQALAATFQGANVVVLYPTQIETRDVSGRVLRRVALKTKRSSALNGVLSPNGFLAAVTSSDYFTTLLFDARTGRELKSLRAEMGGILSAINGELKFSPDGRKLASTT